MMCKKEDEVYLPFPIPQDIPIPFPMHESNYHFTYKVLFIEMKNISCTEQKYYFQCTICITVRMYLEYVITCMSFFVIRLYKSTTVLLHIFLQLLMCVNRELALREELIRQEKLEQLAARFNRKASMRETWLSENQRLVSQVSYDILYI